MLIANLLCKTAREKEMCELYQISIIAAIHEFFPNDRVSLDIIIDDGSKSLFAGRLDLAVMIETINFSLHTAARIRDLLVRCTGLRALVFSVAVLDTHGKKEIIYWCKGCLEE